MLVGLADLVEADLLEGPIPFFGRDSFPVVMSVPARTLVRAVFESYRVPDVGEASLERSAEIDLRPLAAAADDRRILLEHITADPKTPSVTLRLRIGDVGTVTVSVSPSSSGLREFSVALAMLTSAMSATKD